MDEILQGDGNAFAVMSRVSKAMKKKGATSQEIQTYRDETIKGDYDDLYQTAIYWLEKYNY